MFLKNKHDLKEHYYILSNSHNLFHGDVTIANKSFVQDRLQAK